MEITSNKPVWFTKRILLCFAVVFLFLVTTCEKSRPPIDTTKRNGKHDIVVCGVNDPLQNLGWLKEFHESLHDRQDFDSVRIHLYRVIGKEEHLFQIGFSYSSFEFSPFLHSTDWRNCAGELVFHTNAGMPPNPEVLENFMKDKEYVAELLHFVKQ